MRADRLNKLTSADIVNELIRVLGHDRALTILNVSAARFKALRGERACLTDVQLNQISEQTDKTWIRWGVDGGARHAKTSEAMEFVASARAMWDEIEGKPKPGPSHAARRRTKTPSLRHAI